MGEGNVVVSVEIGRSSVMMNLMILLPKEGVLWTILHVKVWNPILALEGWIVYLEMTALYGENGDELFLNNLLPQKSGISF